MPLRQRLCIFYAGGKVDAGKVAYLCALVALLSMVLWLTLFFVGKGFLVLIGCQFGGHIDILGQPPVVCW